MRYRLFLCALILLGTRVATAATPKDYKSDAEASLFYGDFFHSYRSYSYLEEQSPAYFNGQALEGYLKSLFIVGTRSTIKSECDRFSKVKEIKIAARAQYLCGQHFTEGKDAQAAESYLSVMTSASHFFWPAQILRVTDLLISNDAQGAFKLLRTIDLPQYVKYGLGDEFNLALARVYAAENKLDDAIRQYQLIDGKSSFYIAALEETAWAFFKIHHFESAQVLLDVLIGNFETDQRVGTQKVSESTYFRARYLRAYLALSEKRTEGAATAFSDLRTEYEKSLSVVKPTLSSAKILAVIKDQNQKWTDVNNLPKVLKQQLDLISEWEGAEVRKNFENKILYQMALTRELNRTYRFQGMLAGDTANYQKDLRTVQEKTWTEFANGYDDALKKLSKDLETLKIKAELGRLEIVWLKRAEGVRTLDEVIDNYRQEARYLDEFMEK